MNFELWFTTGHVRFFLYWLLASYIAVFASMLLDLFSAWFRSRRLGLEWTSDKQKRTAVKAGKYFVPMLALSLVDILLCSIIHYPYFTLVLALLNCFTEWLSIFEKSRTKEERDKTAKLLQTILLKKNAAEILLKILNSTEYDNKSTNKGQLTDENKCDMVQQDCDL